jgi:DNA-binding CsgD family transcriptional regulator
MPAATAELAASDYRKIFDVLESCEDAADVNEFRHNVVAAVSQVFGIAGVTFFSGPTLAQTFADPEPVTSGDDSGRLLDEYLKVWGRHDVFATPPAMRHLTTTGSVSLDQLHQLSAPAKAYVNGFLRRAGLYSCNAFAVEMGSDGYGLVGVFDPNPTALSARDISAMRLLCRRLRVVSRSLPRSPRRRALSGLSNRQQEVVDLVAQGLSNAEIATTLVLTEDTAKKYVSRALAATGCRTRTELAVRALKDGSASINDSNAAEE